MKIHAYLSYICTIIAPDYWFCCQPSPLLDLTETSNVHDLLFDLLLTLFDPILTSPNWFYSYRASLHIHWSSLQTLELTSLTSIEYGMIFVNQNADLCFADSINWDKLASQHDQDIRVADNAEMATCCKCSKKSVIRPLSLTFTAPSSCHFSENVQNKQRGACYDYDVIIVVSLQL